jgi:hypothetical protein
LGRLERQRNGEKSNRIGSLVGAPVFSEDIHCTMFERRDLYHETTITRVTACCTKYLVGAILIFGTLIQWYLLRRVWIGQRLPDVLGDVNGIASPGRFIRSSFLPAHPFSGYRTLLTIEALGNRIVDTKPTLFQKEPNFDPFNGSDSRWTSLLPQRELKFAHLV